MGEAITLPLICYYSKSRANLSNNTTKQAKGQHEMQTTAHRSPHEAAAVTGTTPEHVARQCAEGKYPGARKVGGQWQIPREADPRLMVIARDEVEDVALLRRTVGGPKMDQALRRLGLLK